MERQRRTLLATDAELVKDAAEKSLEFCKRF